MKINDMLKERKGKLIGDIAIAVFFGVMLILAGDMVFGGGENAETENETVKNNVSDNDYLSKLEEKTKGLLSQVDGAGNVDVMITLNSEGESVYARENKKSASQTEESAQQGDSRGIESKTEESTVVTVNNGDGSTSPVVIKEMTAEISGIVIVAEGGDNVLVKDSLIRAAQALFGVPANNDCCGRVFEFYGK